MPEAATGRRANHFRPRDAVRTSRIRVVLENRPGFASGLSELETWSRDEPSAATAPVPNVALGASAGERPTLTASFSDDEGSLAAINDGEAAFNYYTRSRWSTLGTPRQRDWVEIDFGTTREVRRAEVYFWAWESRGTAAPRAWSVEYWDGNGWSPVRTAGHDPPTPMAMALNVLAFDPVSTTRLRFWFRHAVQAVTAVSEIVVR